MQPTIDVWIIHPTKTVLVTDQPGPPAAMLGYVSEEAKQTAEARGHPTISEVGFVAEDWKRFDDVLEAEAWASAKAQELGYRYDAQYSWDIDEQDDEEEVAGIDEPPEGYEFLDDDDDDDWDLVEDADDWDDDRCPDCGLLYEDCDCDDGPLGVPVEEDDAIDPVTDAQIEDGERRGDRDPDIPF